MRRSNPPKYVHALWQSQRKACSVLHLEDRVFFILRPMGSTRSTAGGRSVDSGGYLTPTRASFLQAGGADAGNGTVELAAVSIGPQYGALGPFRPPGVTGTRWSSLLAWERDTVPCVVGPEGKRHS